MISENAANLRKDSGNWARLSYDVGKLYWYYYSGNRIRNDTGQARISDTLRYARIRAAAQWMHNAAAEKNFASQKVAQVYSDIADFNIQIVPLINEGSDSGKYQPYFMKLRELIDNASVENNDVIRLEAAGLVLDAARVYPRKFRADGIKRNDMSQLVNRAAVLVDAVAPTTDDLDQRKQRVVGSIQPAREAVANAFVDIKGDAR